MYLNLLRYNFDCEQEADLAVSGISISQARAEAIDYSMQYHMEYTAVAIKVESNKLLYFTKPLSGYMYLLLILYMENVDPWLLFRRYMMYPLE